MSEYEIARRLVNGVWTTDARLEPGANGGGEPAGSDGQIQFNDNGAFGASADFTVIPSAGNVNVGLAAGADGTAVIEGIGTGAQIQIVAADSLADGVGGEVGIHSGGGTADGNGGDIQIVTGDASGEGTSGNLTIATGLAAAGGDGGEIIIEANRGAAASGTGGQVLVSGGSGTGNGGDVIVQGGSTNGSVQLYSGDSGTSLELNNNGFVFSGTAQTGVAVTAEAIHAALVSLGLITGP